MSSNWNKKTQRRHVTKDWQTDKQMGKQIKYWISERSINIMAITKADSTLKTFLQNHHLICLKKKNTHRYKDVKCEMITQTLRFSRHFKGRSVEIQTLDGRSKDVYLNEHHFSFLLLLRKEQIQIWWLFANQNDKVHGTDFLLLLWLPEVSLKKCQSGVTGPTHQKHRYNYLLIFSAHSNIFFRTFFLFLLHDIKSLLTHLPIDNIMGKYLLLILVKSLFSKKI